MQTFRCEICTFEIFNGLCQRFPIMCTVGTARMDDFSMVAGTKINIINIYSILAGSILT